MNWFRNGRFDKPSQPMGRLKMDAPCLQCGATRCGDYLADPGFCSVGCEYAHDFARLQMDEWPPPPSEPGVTDEEFEAFRARLLEEQ